MMGSIEIILGIVLTLVGFGLMFFALWALLYGIWWFTIVGLIVGLAVFIYGIKLIWHKRFGF